MRAIIVLAVIGAGGLVYGWTGDSTLGVLAAIGVLVLYLPRLMTRASLQHDEGGAIE